MIIKCMPSGPLGANTYFIASEATGKGFIVDPGGHNINMVNFIKESECTPEYIVLTHGHCDHIGGVDAFKKEFPDIRIVACKEERQLLADPMLNLSAAMLHTEISIEADIWVGDGDTLQVGDMELKFIHTPGHTPGGMCISVGDVLLSGDNLFRQSIGRTDFVGGSFEELRRSVREKLFALPDDTKVLPGHMSATTIEFEKRSNPFV